jgi:glyoxylase-like metal-dependent hydrolase (beta-lactamase superfamily II)
MSGEVKVIPLRIGICNTYLVIENKQCLLVDTGNVGYISKIKKAIVSRGLDLKSLTHIFLTHTHYDHAGNVKELKDITGAKVITHEFEKKFLEKGEHPAPKGTNLWFSIISKTGSLMGKKFKSFEPTNADIIFNDTLDLKKFGFSGKIIHTPGHTLGSSVLYINNKVLAGDTIFNIAGKIFPPFANDTVELLKSWEKLVDLNAEYYYPAHGTRISFHSLQKELENKS